MADQIRVGVIGASDRRGWALWTHRPVLAAAPEYELAAIASSSPQNAAAAAAVWGVPERRAYPTAAELLANPEVDLVTIAVPLIRRAGLVEAALAAGKHVYCEWPLAPDGATAAAMREQAGRRGLRHAVGLQTRHHPTIRHTRELIERGEIGEVLSASLLYSLSTPPTWPARHIPLIGTKAVSRLYIVGGHALDLLRRLVGDFAELSATLATRLPVAHIAETGQQLAIDTPDQISVTGTLRSGAVAGAHLVSGGPRGDGYRIEIHGTAGRLVLTSADDSLIGPDFTLWGGHGPRHELRPLAVPRPARPGPAQAPVAMANVAQVYADLAAAIREGAGFEPDFGTGEQVHRILDAIERSAADGVRQRLG